MSWNSRMFWNVPGDAQFHDLVGGPAGNVLPIEDDLAGVGAVLPVMMLTVVVFPAPLGPISPTMLASSTLKVTLFIATSPPKVFRRLRRMSGS